MWFWGISLKAAVNEMCCSCFTFILCRQTGHRARKPFAKSTWRYASTHWSQTWSCVGVETRMKKIIKESGTSSLSRRNKIELYVLWIFKSKNAVWWMMLKICSLYVSYIAEQRIRCYPVTQNILFTVHIWETSAVFSNKYTSKGRMQG